MEHRTLALQKWNAKTMVLADSHVAQDLPDEFVFEEIVEFSGSYYFFYSLWDDQSHAHKLFYREIDFEKVEMSADILLVEAPERIATQPLGYLNRFSNKVTKNKLQRFVFRISGDHSMMLIKYRTKPEITDEVKGNAKAVLIVFDGRLNRLWNKTVEMPHTENEMYTYDYAIDPEGNTYMSLLISKLPF